MFFGRELRQETIIATYDPHPTSRNTVVLIEIFEYYLLQLGYLHMELGIKIGPVSSGSSINNAFVPEKNGWWELCLESHGKGIDLKKRILDSYV